MLNDEEFAQVAELYSQPLSEPNRTSWGFCSRWQPMLDLYAELTGFQETNQNAIMHHKISLYGPLCQQCEKPLRTPEANQCAACGARRAT